MAGAGSAEDAEHNNMNTTQAAADALAVQIHPDDADQAFVAGVQFARALAGAEPAAFLMALGEQQALIQAAILEAGYADRKARAAGEAFEAGARDERRRIGGAERPSAWGAA